MHTARHHEYTHTLTHARTHRRARTHTRTHTQQAPAGHHCLEPRPHSSRHRLPRRFSHTHTHTHTHTPCRQVGTRRTSRSVAAFELDKRKLSGHLPGVAIGTLRF